MKNVINFLERMGRDAQLRHASPSDIELALSDMQILPELSAAICGQDPSQVEALLGASIVACLMFYDDSDDCEDEANLRQCA